MRRRASSGRRRPFPGGPGQERDTERYAEKRWQQQPAGAAQVDLSPVLNNDNGSDRDGEEDCDWCSYPDRNNEGEQRHRYQCFAEAKSRSDHGGEKYNEKNVESCKVHSLVGLWRQTEAGGDSIPV